MLALIGFSLLWQHTGPFIAKACPFEPATLENTRQNVRFIVVYEMTRFDPLALSDISSVTTSSVSSNRSDRRCQNLRSSDVKSLRGGNIGGGALRNTKMNKLRPQQFIASHSMLYHIIVARLVPRLHRTFTEHWSSARNATEKLADMTPEGLR